MLESIQPRFIITNGTFISVIIAITIVMIISACFTATPGDLWVLILGERSWLGVGKLVAAECNIQSSVKLSF